MILDTTDRPDLAELIEIQEKLPPGDVVSAWARLLDGPKDHLALVLQFQRPIETVCVLNFDLRKQGSVVELALRARAIYLQAGKPGDRLYRTLDAPRMIVEIGAEILSTRWNELWLKAIKRKLKPEGLRNSEAKKISEQYIEEMRAKFRDAKSLGSGLYVDPRTAATNDAELARKGG